MEAQSRFPRSILGKVFPDGFVAVMVEEPSTVSHVLVALARIGVGEGDVRVVPGGRALEIDGSHHPSLDASVPVSGEDEVSGIFVAGALLGDVLVGIRAPSSADAGEIVQVLLEERTRCPWRFEGGSIVEMREPVGSAA
jgi:hypothetical protein